MKKFIESISDLIYGIRYLNFRFKFALANFIMGDELRQAISSARHNIDFAIKYVDKSPDFCKKRLKQSYDELYDIIERKD